MAAKFFLKAGEEKRGPFNIPQLNRMFQSGEVVPSTPCQREDSDVWMPIGHFFAHMRAADKLAPILSADPSPMAVHDETVPSSPAPGQSRRSVVVDVTRLGKAYRSIKILPGHRWWFGTSLFGGRVAILLLALVAAGVVFAEIWLFLFGPEWIGHRQANPGVDIAWDIVWVSLVVAIWILRYITPPLFASWRFHSALRKLNGKTIDWWFAQLRQRRRMLPKRPIHFNQEGFKIVGITLAATAVDLTVTAGAGVFFALVFKIIPYHLSALDAGLAAAVLAVLIPLSSKFKSYAQKLRAMPAEAVLKADTRQPVLLLRSFSDDEISLSRKSMLLFDVEFTFEETIIPLYWQIGPVTAIGRPGEKLPPVGAVREYVDDEHWKDRVQQRAAAAGIIVAALGNTEGFLWEITHLYSRARESTLHLVLPPLNEVAKGQRLRKLIAHLRELHVDVEPFAHVNPGSAILFSSHGDLPLAVYQAASPSIEDYEVAVLLAVFESQAAALP